MSALTATHRVDLQPLHTFGLPATASDLRLLSSAEDLQALAQARQAGQPWLLLGEGSNTVFVNPQLNATVWKVALKGRQYLGCDSVHHHLRVQAGENWHQTVEWTVAKGWGGLENLALIPGCVGASPVQNIGAYGVELQDRFHELDAIDLHTGQTFTLNAAQCGFGYRDSVFKHTPAGETGLGLAGRAVITRVRFWLPKPWKPVLGYADLERKMAETGCTNPDARQIFDWVCAIRRAKLPDPAVIGNAGSFFKNPTVTPEQCQDIIARDPKIVHYPMPDGSIKLAAGWLIDACGWKGKSMGRAGVYDKQALVLVNRGDRHSVDSSVTGGEVMTLAGAIQTSVYERFGIRLEPEPVVV